MTSEDMFNDMEKRNPNARFTRALYNLVAQERAEELYGPWGVEFSSDLTSIISDSYSPGHPGSGTVLEELMGYLRCGDGEPKRVYYCRVNPTLPPRTMSLKRLWDNAPTSPSAPMEEV